MFWGKLWMRAEHSLDSPTPAAHLLPVLPGCFSNPMCWFGKWSC